MDLVLVRVVMAGRIESDSCGVSVRAECADVARAGEYPLLSAGRTVAVVRIEERQLSEWVYVRQGGHTGRRECLVLDGGLDNGLVDEVWLEGGFELD